jgi:ABC-type sugar transport system permease subunit
VRRRRRRSGSAPYLFLLPFFVVYGTFLLYPVVSALRLSFYTKTGFDPARFDGLANYSRLLSDTRFRHALLNTTLYSCGAVFVLSPLALLVAVVVRSKIVPWGRLRTFYRIAFFLPNITSLVVIAIMFGLVLQQDNGLVNGLLRSVGVSGPHWLTSQSLALPSIVLVAIWTYTGLNSLYFLGGLQSISDDIYEAASLDGAGAVSTFFRITLPLLRPTILFVVVQAIIFSFQVFELPWLLTGGGPSDATLTLGVYLYQVGFVQFDQGYASAVGYAIALITVLLTGVQLLLFRAFGGSGAD